MVVEKGKVLATKGGRAIVELSDSRKITVNVKSGIKIRNGDMVIIAFGSIVDKA